SATCRYSSHRAWPSPASTRTRAVPIRRERPVRLAPVRPDRIPARRPCPARRPSGGHVRLFRQAGPDHAVAGDEFAQVVLAPVLGAHWTYRQDEIANLRGRIPDANAGALRQLEAEFPQYGARLFHRLGPV